VSQKWQDALWAELEEMDALQQHVACGEWITEMQQQLVPRLSVRRRLKIVEASEQHHHDYLKMAELIGSRKGTIKRLVDEGRSLQREHGDDQAA
jgi:HAMP domain-containing protein